MQCAVCGKMFPAITAVIDDNGNPVCSDCAAKAPKEKSKR